MTKQLCKWCFHIRKTKDNDWHTKCKGNNQCECRCREIYKQPEAWNTPHSSNLPIVKYH